jgi:hypothetical protein
MALREQQTAEGHESVNLNLHLSVNMDIEINSNQ